MKTISLCQAAIRTGSLLMGHAREREGKQAIRQRLGNRETVACDLHGSVVINIRRGRVWITHSNQAGDFILKDGDRFTSHQPGRIVIESLADESDIVMSA